RLKVFGLRGDDLREFARGRLLVVRLVVGDAEVEADGVLRGVNLERVLVALDRLPVIPQARVDDAQVRERVEAARDFLQGRLVGRARAFEVALLLQTDAAREVGLGLPHGRRV